MTTPHPRRTFLALAALSVTSASLNGCSLFGAEQPGSDSAAQPAESMAPVAGSRTLVAFFSVPETDDPNGMSRDEENSTHVVDGKVYGNTEYIAKLVAERLGAGQFRIETAEQLPLDHQTLIDRAVEWQDTDARPDLKELIPNLEEFDTVIVGYPIWEYDMPMPLYTFFEQHDFTGKNVYVYTTHDVSGLSGTLEKITQLLPEASVSNNAFDISRNDMEESEARVEEWINTLGA